MVLSRFAGLVVAALFVTGLPATAAPPPAPLYTTGALDEVPGEYIVVLKPGATTLTGPLGVASRFGGVVRREYTAALRGFHASLPTAAVEKLRRDPSAAFVQTNRVHPQPLLEASGSQSNAPWHLDRIDQRQLPLNRPTTTRTMPPG